MTTKVLSVLRRFDSITRMELRDAMPSAHTQAVYRALRKLIAQGLVEEVAGGHRPGLRESGLRVTEKGKAA